MRYGSQPATGDRRPATERCDWCKARAVEKEWNGTFLCPGCWVDLTVDEYLRAWSADPAVARALTYKGVPLAATLEYEMLEKLVSVFAKLMPSARPENPPTAHDSPPKTHDP